MEILFRCVICGSPVGTPEEQLQCIECKKVYDQNAGVYRFSQSNHYYSDLDRERMRVINEKCESDGWRNTVKKYFSDNPFLFKIITDETRADWQYLLPLNSESIALDIGAGWGTISIPLARNIKHVVALDGTVDRLEFLSIRANQEDLENITIVHADIFQHPFKNEQFDVVSFNGVLEWVAVGNEDMSPEQKQLQALHIAYDLLKPGGYLYIGIENAYGLKYILGEPDDHTGIKHITYLPRVEADELSRKINKANYRTYTYTQQGYESLLKQSGFTNLQYYYPYPDYKLIKSIHNLDNKNVSGFLTETQRYIAPSHSMSERINDLERLLAEYGDLVPFPASYSILAHKEG